MVGSLNGLVGNEVQRVCAMPMTNVLEPMRPDESCGVLDDELLRPGMSREPGMSCLRVLLVEDEPLIRWSIAEALKAKGHVVREASDAASARHTLVADDAPLDVVLLDLRLPDSCDLSLLQDIRRLKPNSAVVMMTAHEGSDIVDRARECGAYAVIDKPFDLDGVELLLRTACASPWA
jgi:DNA-binding NtrC family response regulator